MILKRASEIALMLESARINREALEAVEAYIKPGVSTLELNKIAEDAILSRGGRPAFKGYRHPSGGKPFPATLCTSVNEVVVHGIPNDKPLKDGDVLSIDIGTFYKGYAGDMAKTYAIGNISAKAKRLLEVTENSLYAGIEQARAGNRLGDISAAIQQVIETAGFWAIREFVGHGLGLDFHEAPEVPNFGKAGQGPILRPGLVLAIEPMVSEKRAKVKVLKDGWTAPTANNALAAHFEHTVAITEQGPLILTAKDVRPLAVAA